MRRSFLYLLCYTNLKLYCLISNFQLLNLTSYLQEQSPGMRFKLAEGLLYKYGRVIISRPAFRNHCILFVRSHWLAPISN
jgi:hypothetical protein